MANSILLARFLGPAGRGEVAAAMLWPGMLIYLGTCGVLPAGVFFAAERSVRLSEVFATTAFLGLLLSFLTMLIGHLSLPWLLQNQSAEVIRSSRLLLFMIPASVVGMCGTNLLLGGMYVTSMNMLRLIGPIGYVAGTVSLHATGLLSVRSIVLLHIGLNVTFLVTTTLVLARLGLLRGLRIDGQLLDRIWRYGLKAHLGTLGGMANQNASQALLASFAAPAQLGIYVTASSAAGVVQALPNAIQALTLPRVRLAESLSEQKRMLRQILRRYWLAAVACGIPYCLVLPWLIVFFFTRDFGGGTLPAELLVVCGLLIGTRDILIAGLQAMGRPLTGSGIQWIGALINVALLSFLLPMWGITGAAIAALISAATQTGLLATEIFRAQGVSSPACQVTIST